MRVTTCGASRAFPGFAYNVFAMMHARSEAEIRNATQRFATTYGIGTFALLKTKKELKKEPVRVVTDE